MDYSGELIKSAKFFVSAGVASSDRDRRRSGEVVSVVFG